MKQIIPSSFFGLVFHEMCSV